MARRFGCSFPHSCVACAARAARATSIARRRATGLVACALTIAAWAAPARADDAVIAVDPSPTYAQPPPSSCGARDPSGDPGARDDAIARPRGDVDDRARAASRVSLGPALASTGRGAALGVGAALDLGAGTVGARVGASWMRGGDRDALDALAQATLELTVDLRARGPWHPVVALGAGYAHVDRADAAGDAAIGTARVGVEYALPLADADVRVGASLLGALVGPADRAAADLRGWGVVAATLAIGL